MKKYLIIFLIITVVFTVCPFLLSNNMRVFELNNVDFMSGTLETALSAVFSKPCELWFESLSSVLIFLKISRFVPAYVYQVLLILPFSIAFTVLSIVPDKLISYLPRVNFADMKWYKSPSVLMTVVLSITLVLWTLNIRSMVQKQMDREVQRAVMDSLIADTTIGMGKAEYLAQNKLFVGNELSFELTTQKQVDYLKSIYGLSKNSTNILIAFSPENLSESILIGDSVLSFNYGIDIDVDDDYEIKEDLLETEYPKNYLKFSVLFRDGKAYGWIADHDDFMMSKNRILSYEGGLDEYFRERLNTNDGALLASVKSANVEAVKLLLSAGANPNVDIGSGLTSLYVAVSKGNTEIVELLIDGGGDIHMQTNGGQTPIKIAIIKGYKEVVELLIVKGANVNEKDKTGMTLLHWVVFADRGNLVKINFITIRIEGGKASVSKTAEQDHKGTAELLINKGADVNAQEESGMTPLDLSKDDDMRELLLKHGAKSGKD